MPSRFFVVPGPLATASGRLLTQYSQVPIAQPDVFVSAG